MAVFETDRMGPVRREGRPLVQDDPVVYTLDADLAFPGREPVDADCIADIFNSRQWSAIDLKGMNVRPGELPFFNRLEVQTHLSDLSISGVNGAWLREQNFLLWLEHSRCLRLMLDVEGLDQNLLREILERVPLLEHLEVRGWVDSDLPANGVVLSHLTSLILGSCSEALITWCQAVSAQLRVLGVAQLSVTPDRLDEGIPTLASLCFTWA